MLAGGHDGVSAVISEQTASCPPAELAYVDGPVTG
jgi:hypothetical protein